MEVEIRSTRVLYKVCHDRATGEDVEVGPEFVAAAEEDVVSTDLVVKASAAGLNVLA